jgi:hypothetical protein
VSFFMQRIGVQLAGTRLAVEHDARGRLAAIQFESWTVVVQLDQCAAPGVRDALE